MRFRIKFLPATFGDCIWIEYGNDNDLHRVLIDGGTGGTKRTILSLLDNLPAEERIFELMVVTHIDKDHIQGIESLLNDQTLNFAVKDFWFNGWRHLPEEVDVESFGALQAERMTKNLIRHGLPWNQAFSGEAVAISDSGELPVVFLPGGLKITLLSPTRKQLADLKPKWEDEIIEAGLVPGFGDGIVDEPTPTGIETFGVSDPKIDELNKEPFTEDGSAANGSSIAFLAEFEGKKVLFLGDALPSQIAGSITKLKGTGRFPVDVVKVSHHGSAGNTSPQLIEMLDCKQYAISTNGSTYKHPKPVTIARLIKRAGPDVN